MLGKGIAKATLAAPSLCPIALLFEDDPTQTRKEGQGEALEIFRYIPHPRRLSPHPAARKMDIPQRAKLAEQPHPAAAGRPDPQEGLTK